MSESLGWSVVAASGAKSGGSAWPALEGFVLARIAEAEADAGREGIAGGFRDGDPCGPGRVLEVCALMRRLVGRAQRTGVWGFVLDLAAVWADHADYRKEWAL